MSRDHYYKKAYGIDAATADALKAKGCQICGEPAFAIDHCHKTGIVRGALCHRCNTGIGWMNDSPELLRKAALYLELTPAAEGE